MTLDPIVLQVHPNENSTGNWSQQSNYQNYQGFKDGRLWVSTWVTSFFVKTPNMVAFSFSSLPGEGGVLDIRVLNLSELFVNSPTLLRFICKPLTQCSWSFYGHLQVCAELWKFKLPDSHVPSSSQTRLSYGKEVSFCSLSSVTLCVFCWRCCGLK